MPDDDNGAIARDEAEDSSSDARRDTSGDDPGDGDEVVEAELVEEGADADQAPGGMESLLGGLDGVDMESLLGSAMQIQQQMVQAQQEAAGTEVEGQAGGGAVRVLVTGGFEFLRVTISPEAVDPDDVEMLEDLVLAAVRDAVDRAASLTQTAMPSLGGMGLDDITSGSGMDLGGLLGAFGGEASDDDDDYDDDDYDDDGGDGDDDDYGDGDGDGQSARDGEGGGGKNP